MFPKQHIPKAATWVQFSVGACVGELDRACIKRVSLDPSGLGAFLGTGEGDNTRAIFCIPG